MRRGSTGAVLLFAMVLAVAWRVGYAFQRIPRAHSLVRPGFGKARSYSQSPVVWARKKKEHRYQLELDSEENWDAWEFGQERAMDEEGGEPRRGEAQPEEDEEDAAASQVSNADIVKATAVVSRFCTGDRMNRLHTILGRRTRHVRFVFENPSNPNNIWACLRTLDSFGLQYVDVICDPSHYSKAHRLFSMKSAMGAQRWLTLTAHPTATACVESLRAQGYRIVAADLHPGTTPKLVQQVDWASSPVAVVMGNEERGITQEMRDLCDFTYQIPMLGFAESFNLSVSTAVTLAYINSLGGLKHGDLSSDEREKLMLRWVMKSVRGSAAILRREGLIHSADGVLAPKESILGYKIK